MSINEGVAADAKKPEASMGCGCVALVLVVPLALIFVYYVAFVLGGEDRVFESETEAVRGSAVLSSENPVVEISVSVEQDGQPVIVRDFVNVRLTSTSLDGSDTSEISVQKNGLGNGTVTLAAEMPNLGPVQVDWEIFGRVFGDTPTTLTVDAPPDSSAIGPVAASIELYTGLRSLVVHRVMVELGAGEEPLIVRLSELPFRGDPGLSVFLENGEAFDMQRDEQLSVPRPNGCADGCSFRLEVVSSEDRRGGPTSVEFLTTGSAELSVEEEDVEFDERRGEIFLDLAPLELERSSMEIPIGVRFTAQPAHPGDVVQHYGLSHPELNPAAEPDRSHFLQEPFQIAQVDEIAPTGCEVLQFNLRSHSGDDFDDAPDRILEAFGLVQNGPVFDLEGNRIERGPLEVVQLTDAEADSFCDR